MKGNRPSEACRFNHSICGLFFPSYRLRSFSELLKPNKLFGDNVSSLKTLLPVEKDSDNRRRWPRLYWSEQLRCRIGLQHPEFMYVSRTGLRDVDVHER
jgi:hypothetical protein